MLKKVERGRIYYTLFFFFFDDNYNSSVTDKDA